jgi:hypothetical protein
VESACGEGVHVQVQVEVQVHVQAVNQLDMGARSDLMLLHRHLPDVDSDLVVDVDLDVDLDVDTIPPWKSDFR